MASRTWMRCKCGAKLHAKQGFKQCGSCIQKERRVKNVRVQK